MEVARSQWSAGAKGCLTLQLTSLGEEKFSTGYWLLTSGYFHCLTRERAACCNRIQTSVTPKRAVNRLRKREVERSASQRTHLRLEPRRADVRPPAATHPSGRRDAARRPPVAVGLRAFGREKDRTASPDGRAAD